jgi:hypothetical protein
VPKQLLKDMAFTRGPLPPTGRRLLDLEAAGDYLSVSGRTVLRLIHAGLLPVVKLPVERSATGAAKLGINKRILVDLRDLDDLIDQSKERHRRE